MTGKSGEKKPQRELIMAKSSVLFWKKGYSDTSMRDIANACGFRAANIYNFFSNKEEILYEILLDEMSQIVDSMRPIEDDDDGDPIQQLQMIIKNHVKLTLGAKRSSMLLFDVGLGMLSTKNRKQVISIRDDYDRILGRVIQRGIEKGVFAKIDVKMAVFGIASMIARSRIWFSPKGRSSINEVVDFISNFSLNGLRNQLCE